MCTNLASKHDVRRASIILKSSVFSGVVLSLCLFARASTAEPQSPDGAAAQALFDEGRNLVGQGKYAEACPKFEESHRLDAGLGTLINLADCWDRLGRTASAWSTFLEVADAARTAGQPERERVARERAKALGPRLSKLKISVPAAHRIPGLRVTKNNAEVGAPQWDVAVPIDPGKHVVVASAHGRSDVRIEVVVASNADIKRVTIPLLPESSQAGTPSELGASERSSGASGYKTAGLIAGGAGILTIGMGAYFGLRAISKFDQSNEEGCKDNVCPAGSKQTREAAVSSGNVSTALFLAGGALVAGGATLYLVGSSKAQHGVQVGASPSALWLSGKF